MNTPLINHPSLKDLESQTEYPLGETTIIGRHEDCNLVLKSERGASRKHARITIENGSAILMDLGSLNGTTVNGREISRAVQLVDGDIVVFDENQYLYQAPVATQSGQSDNVTVIANKDEIGRPERIKPAIRVVDTAANASVAQANAPQANSPQAHASAAQADSMQSAASKGQSNFNHSMANDRVASRPASNDHVANPALFDETETESIAEQPMQEQQAYTGNTAIPATSRPGGDAPTPARLQKRQEHYGEQLEYDRARSKSRRWLWIVLIPLAVLLVAGAFYSVYQAGFSAANTPVSVNEPND